jgi:hypothetical protein
VLGVICSAGTESESAANLKTLSQTLSGGPSRWQLTMGYRWQDSYRHYSGDVEQTQRLLQQTQMENKLHLFDVGLSYVLNSRWSVSGSVPVLKADRINHRTGGVTNAAGIGDMSVGIGTWIWRPPSENHMNVQVGMSLKIPTGIPDYTNRVTAANGTQSVTTVDQSIQLGDSGWGFSMSYMGYKSIQRFTLFSTGTYLFNPKNTYTAKTPGSRQLSVPDQYNWRAGVGYAVPHIRGLAFTFGGRMEGVPARDLIGREDGFRRPGYAVSIEPGVQFEHGRDMWSLSVAIAQMRDRTRSVPDIRNGTHGDAAFADSVFMMGYSRSF